MLDFPRWKVWSVSILLIIGIAFAIPSFVPEAQVAKWPGFMPTARINLGLDLAGGSHLLLEADTSDVAKQRIALMEETVRTEMRRASPRIQRSEEHTSELQSLMRISYAVFCLKKKKQKLYKT